MSINPGPSGCKYTTAPGFHTELFGPLKTPCAVIIPPNAATVVLSGHLGLDEKFQTPGTLEEEVELVFKHIETTLHHAGVSQGWGDVYQINSFQSKSAAPDEEAFFDAFLRVRDKYVGENTPTWTNVTVPELHGRAAIEMNVHAVLQQSQSPSSKI